MRKNFFVFFVLLIFFCVFGSCQKLPTYPDSGPADSIFLLTPYQITSWGLPNSQPFTPVGVAIDNNLGRLYATNFANNKIEVFDLNGGFLSEWGNNFNQPVGIAVDQQGNIYVSDTNNNKVEKFNSNGMAINSWGVNGVVQGIFSGQYGLNPDISGNLYVADRGNNRVIKLDINGNFLNYLGTAGTGNGQFASPRDVAINFSSGFIYTTDGYRVQIFDSNEKYVSQIPILSLPFDLTIDKSGNILVSDQLHYQFQEFDTNGNLITTWEAPGYPDGIAVDDLGNIYTAIISGSLVIKYSPPITYEITPNPAHTGQNPVFIFNLVSPVSYTIDIQSMSESTDVFHYSGQGAAGNNQITWDVSSVSNGVYLATFTSGSTKVQNTITIAK
jgi:hypothetical protein